MAKGSYKLVWKGPLLVSRARAASVAGVNETMARCVVFAKGVVRVRTATLQGSIRFEPAKVVGSGVQGVWGSFDVNYAIFQELGTVYMSARPFLRPAADQEYGLLEARIRRHMP